MKYLFLSLIIFSCNALEKKIFPSLVNTKWVCNITEECTNYIAFNKDSTYVFYSCEIDYPFSGKYEVNNDTLYLVEIDLASDVLRENIKNNYKEDIKSRVKGILKDEMLKFFDKEDFIDGKWVKVKYQPSKEILYMQVK